MGSKKKKHMFCLITDMMRECVDLKEQKKKSTYERQLHPMSSIASKTAAAASLRYPTVVTSAHPLAPCG
jgi:hypothetical protein